MQRATAPMTAMLAVAGLLPTLAAHAASLTTLYTFKGGQLGAYPSAGVTAANGALYGTTSEGGAAGLGVVFKVDPATGAEIVVHDFAGRHDGAMPLSGLTADVANARNALGAAGTARFLYGTTFQGGKFNDGTVFRIDVSTGALTVLHTFHGADGAGPQGGLDYYGDAGNGVLFGTTANGGAAGFGTVFRIDAATGAEKLLYSFTGGADGANPLASVIRVGHVLFGTTSTGGTAAGGTLFKLDAQNGRQTTLYGFIGNDNGVGGPLDQLMYARGSLYGTTFGTNPIAMGSTCAGQGCGTVFKINARTGLGTTLYSFAGNADGAYPMAGLTEHGGVLYGTTFHGGGNWCYSQWGGCGTIYRVNPVSGAESAIYTFTGGSDGENPAANLTFVDGAFYGTTTGADNMSGCNTGCGTVFRLTP